MSQPTHETARRFVAAALCDLIGSLASEENPIVSGGGYPKTKLIQAATRWATARRISLVNPDGPGWLLACQNGTMLPDELGGT